MGSVVLIILGIIFAIYDVLLLCINPANFMDTIFSFTHIWLAAGIYCIFVGIYRKKAGHSFWSVWKKWIKITVSIILCCGVLISSIILGMILTPDTVKVTDKPSAEYLIILGGGIDKNGNLPPSVKRRVEKAAVYLLMNPETECVVSGGTVHWNYYAEAPAIKALLMEKGINEERIMLEDKSVDTIENLIFSCKKISEIKGISEKEVLESSVVIVTSKFHLNRAQILARRIGYTNIKGIPAKISVFKAPMSYVREIFAYVKLALRIILTGKPSNILLT